MTPFAKDFLDVTRPYWGEIIDRVMLNLRKSINASSRGTSSTLPLPNAQRGSAHHAASSRGYSHRDNDEKFRSRPAL